MAIQFDTTDATLFDVDAADGMDDEAAPAMNTTPLIDVLLVLLVMLIITIPIQLHSVRMDLPAALPPEDAAFPLVVKLDISETSAIALNGELLANQSELQRRLEIAAGGAAQPEVHVQAHAKTPYDTVAAVLTMAQRAGLIKIGVVGLEEYASRAQ